MSREGRANGGATHKAQKKTRKTRIRKMVLVRLALRALRRPAGARALSSLQSSGEPSSCSLLMPNVVF